MQRKRRRAVGYAFIGAVITFFSGSVIGAEVVIEVIFSIGMIIAQLAYLLPTDE